MYSVLQLLGIKRQVTCAGRISAAASSRSSGSTLHLDFVRVSAHLHCVTLTARSDGLNMWPVERGTVSN